MTGSDERKYCRKEAMAALFILPHHTAVHAALHVRLGVKDNAIVASKELKETVG